MSREPFSHEDEIAQQQEAMRKQLSIDYKATFAGTRGQRVLDDLKRLFGFDKPSASYGMKNEDVWLREGMKLPLYHIDRHLKANFQKPDRRKRKADDKQRINP